MEPITLKLLNTADTYKTLQPFSSVEELNANTSAIRNQYAEQMTPSTYRVLDVLHRYACVYPGVCYRSKAKIAVELGIDRKTVTRACAALESLGVIKQYETKRAGGDRRRSTNAIVFMPVTSKEVAQPVPAEVPTACPVQEAPANTPKILNNTRDTVNAEFPSQSEIIKSGLIAKLPKEIGIALGVFFDTTDIHRLYGVMLKAKASVDRLLKFEDAEMDYAHSLRSVISAWKRGKVRSLDAVIYEATRRVARRLWLTERFDEFMTS